MSSTPRYVRVVLGAALCLATAQPARAVQQAPTVAEQAARVARLNHLRDLAAAAADSAERSAGTRWPVDTVHAGPLTVLTDRSVVPAVQAGVALAWQQLAPTLGNDTSVLRSEWMFIYFQNTRARPQPGAGPACRLEHGVYSCTSSKPGSAPSPVRRGVHIGWSAAMPTNATPDDVANEVQRMVGERFGEAWERSFIVGEHRLSRWPGGYSPMPLPRDSVLRGETYVELVTSASQVAHQCYDGDLKACRVALGLDSVPDPATAWYTASQRRLLVQHVFPPWRGIRRVEPCTVLGDDAACIAALRELSGDPTGYPSIWPLSARARQSVLLVAVTLGGPGAYARLVTDRSTTPSARVTAAARVPLDSVVAAWRAQIIAARPLSPEVAGGTQWATLFWAVAFGVLALRSTKWRSA